MSSTDDKTKKVSEVAEAEAEAEAKAKAKAEAKTEAEAKAKAEEKAEADKAEKAKAKAAKSAKFTWKYAGRRKSVEHKAGEAFAGSEAECVQCLGLGLLVEKKKKK